MSEKNELIAYAMDFASYLISKINGIDRVILHGSVSRGDFDEKSDIDLFIDADKKTEKKISKFEKDYHKTNKFKEWELKGIDREFSIIVGKLDSKEWKNLKRAIMNTGLVLYGKYKAEAEKIKHYTLFSFENIKPNKKRISIYRKLFGFKVGKKRYEGLVDRIGAIKVGKGSLLVPIEHVNELKKYFQEKRITLRLFDVWLD